MSPSPEKIIIVDDEQRMCESLSKLLTNEGYKVTAFQHSFEAAEAIRESKVDLVLTDIKMPRLDGLELLKIVKEVDEDIPVILMTGYASLDSALDAIAHGAYDYLMKPVEFTQLVLTVKRALEKRSADLNRLALLEELKISNLILHRRINELNALYEAGKSIGSAANLKELLRQIVALACNVTEAQVGSIMLLDDRGQYLTVEAAIGLEKDVVESTRLPIGESIAGTVAETGEPIIIEDVENDSRFKRINKEKYGAASLLCTPLKIKNKVIGVINMANKASDQIFSKNDLKLLATFASQAAVAVDDAHQFEKKRRRLIEFEILHEISKELPEITDIHNFRETLVNKLSRVFPIDYCLWFEWDKDNNILLLNGQFGLDKIPVTKSGKIDLKQVNWEELVINTPEDNSFTFDDIPTLTEEVKKQIIDNQFLPEPTDGVMAIPLLKYGEPTYVIFLGRYDDALYAEEDISLARLIISQSALLFEKEKSLLNATRLLTMGNMISEISHDLRRPLTTIKGGLQVIRGKLDNPGHTENLFSTVEEEVHRMNELVRELVDFSNPNKYQTEKIDLTKVVHKAGELIQPELRKKNISYESSFEDTDWHVIINKNQILEAFLNLFLNAIDAMKTNGSLSVHGLVERPEHKKADYLAVKITDDGCGIKKENISRVFDRYFTTKDTGTGLGLAVVERIISAHGGTLAVSSEENKGTTFTIYLPILEK